MGRKPSNCHQLRVLLPFLYMYMLQDQPWSICSPQRRSYLFLTLFLTGASFLKLVFFYLGFWCFSISMTTTLHSASHSCIQNFQKSLVIFWQLLNISIYLPSLGFYLSEITMHPFKYLLFTCKVRINESNSWFTSQILTFTVKHYSKI